MRRIGLLLSSLLCAGMLLASGISSACPETAQESDAQKAVKSAGTKGETKGNEAHPLLTPSKATKQGALDDRLIRPHRTLDASAGILG